MGSSPPAPPPPPPPPPFCARSAAAVQHVATCVRVLCNQPYRTSCRQSRMQTGHEGLSFSQRATHIAWKVCAHAGRMLSSSPGMHRVADWDAQGCRLGCTGLQLGLQAGRVLISSHLISSHLIPSRVQVLTLCGSTHHGSTYYGILTLVVLVLAHDAQSVLPLQGILGTEEGAPG